jgi:hypothetical protein
LDIVSSALKKEHGKDMIAAIPDLRSFKCHHWAYARESMLKVIREMQAG